MNSCYVIAEAGVNHNGSEKIAIELIRVAAEAGADAVKFQTFKAKNLVSKTAQTAKYQRLQTGENNQFSMLEKLEISKDFHIKLVNQCRQLGIEFLSTPFDIDSAKFLLDLGMKKIKISSGEITNIPFIKQLASLNKPLILSTGMSSLMEVSVAIDAIKVTRENNGFNEPLERCLTVLHCTSNYPANYEDVNLKAMETMRKEFSVPVGYSDHTEGIFVAVSAVAMGSVLIEKHFTLDKALKGPDHKASLDIAELSEMIRQIREINKCLGDGAKVPKDNELHVRDVVRRSIMLNIDRPAGYVLKEEDFLILRPGTGISPSEIKQLVGRSLRKNFSNGIPIQWSDVN